MTNDRLSTDLDTIDINNLIDAMSAFYNDSISYNEDRWRHAELNYKSCYGDRNKILENSRYFHLNYIESAVDTVLGIASEDNKIPTFIPVNEDKQTPDQFNKLYVQCNNKMQYDRKLMRARKLTLIGGECLLQLYYNKALTPMGYPDIKVLPYNAYMTDEGWSDPTFSDGNQVLIQEYITKPQAIRLFPKFKEEILNSKSAGSTETFSFNYRSDYSNKYRNENMVRILRYGYRTLREAEYLINPNTGEVYFGNFDKEMVEASGNNLRIMKYLKPTWKLGVAINRTAVYLGDNPLNIDASPFIPMYFERHPEYGLSKSRSLVDRMDGIVRMLRRKMLVNHDLSDDPTASMVIMNKRAISNHEQIHTKNRHKILYVDNSDMKASDAVYRIPYVGASPTDLQLTQLTLDSVGRISGVTDTLSGLAKQDRVTTATSLMRDNSSKQSFAEHFKMWNESVRQFAKVWLEFIQNNWTPGRLRQELQEEPSNYFKSKVFSDYNIAISEVEKTDTWRNRSLATLLEIAQYSGGVAPPASYMAKLANASQELVEQLEEKEKKAQQLEEEERKINMQLVEERLKVMIADAFRKIQSGFEREDKREANRGLSAERVSQSIKNIADASKSEAEAQAALIKAMSEENIKLKAALREYEKIKDSTEQKQLEYDIQQEEEKVESEQANLERFSALASSNPSSFAGQEQPTSDSIPQPEEVQDA